MINEFTIEGKFAVLQDGRKVHYTRLIPALDAAKMWDISLSRALDELYDGERLDNEQLFKEEPKLLPRYTERWNTIKREMGAA